MVIIMIIVGAESGLAKCVFVKTLNRYKGKREDHMWGALKT